MIIYEEGDLKGRMRRYHTALLLDASIGKSTHRVKGVALPLHVTPRKVTRVSLIVSFCCARLTYIPHVQATESPSPPPLHQQLAF